MGGGANAQSLAQSGDNRWVVIASRQDIVESIGMAGGYVGQKARVVQSGNGWYAVVLGPYKAKTISQFLGAYSGPDIPPDAYLARGSDFVKTVWRESDRWVLLASREDRDEAVLIARIYAGHQPRVVQSQNGWYAVVLGPYEASDISSFRAGFDGPTIPDDAMLSRGKSFMATAWTPGESDSSATDSEPAPPPEPEAVNPERAPCFAIIAGKCSPG